MKQIQIICVVLLFSIPYIAHSTQPMDALREPIDEVIRTLKDPQYKDTAKKSTQREKIWQITQNVFDFREISIRALARSWKKLTPEQQNEFTDVFSRFLSNTYIDRIQGEFRNEKIVYQAQKMISENKAIVKTKIIRENSIEVPVEYRMWMRKNTWRIYDVRIEGVSLVKNYRTQFKQILMKETPDQLIERLKTKLEKQKSKTSSKAPINFKGIYNRSKYAWQILIKKFFVLLWLDSDEIKAYASR